MSVIDVSSGDDAVATWPSSVYSAMGDGNPIAPASYVVWYNSTSGEYEARSCADGTIVANGSAFHTVFRTTCGLFTDSGGGTIFFKEGTYTVTNPLDLDYNASTHPNGNIRLIGASQFRTIFNNTNAAAGNTIEYDSATRGYFLHIENIRFTSSATAACGDYIHWDTVDNSIIRNCAFYGNAAGTMGEGIYLTDSYFNLIENCFFAGASQMGHGIQLSDASATANCNIIRNNMIGGVLTGGMEIEGCSANSVRDVYLNALGGTYGIQLDCTSAAITNTVLDHIIIVDATYPSATGIHIVGTAVNRCRNVTISNCSLNSGGRGIDAQYAEFVRIENCNFASNTTESIRIQNFCTDVLISNPYTADTTFITNAATGEVKINGVNYQRSGTSTGTGAEQTIAHGLADGSGGYTPSLVILSDIEDGALPYQSSAADATNIYITAVNNQDWAWYAEYKP